MVGVPCGTKVIELHLSDGSTQTFKLKRPTLREKQLAFNKSGVDVDDKNEMRGSLDQKITMGVIRLAKSIVEPAMYSNNDDAVRDLPEDVFEYLIKQLNEIQSLHPLESSNSATA
jgi:hypothetical protein